MIIKPRNMATQTIQDKKISDKVRLITSHLSAIDDLITTEQIEKRSWEMSSYASKYRKYLQDMSATIKKAKAIRL